MELWHSPVPILPGCQCRRERFFFLAGSSGSFLSELPGCRRNSSPGGTQPLGAPGSQRWAAAQHGAALWTSAPGVPPNARPSVCFVPFPSPAWACKHSAPDLILVESKRLLSTTGGRMQRRSAGSALLPERGILIILMRGQLAEGVRSSPRVCVLVIYRQ